MSGTSKGYASTRLLFNVRYCDEIPADVLAMRCPVLLQATLLRDCYVMSGTEIGYDATRFLRDIQLWCYQARGHEHPHGAASEWARLAKQYAVQINAMLLPACYATSGTDLGHMLLCACSVLTRLCCYQAREQLAATRPARTRQCGCCAMSSTGIWYGAMSLQSSCATSGTVMAYVGIVLCDARYEVLVSQYKAAANRWILRGKFWY
eukprot:442051-Rhodomonas_salina.3